MRPTNHLTAGSSSELSRLITCDERGAEPRPATNFDRPHVQTVEQALDVIGGRIADDKFADEVRRILDEGRDVKYSLLIKADQKRGGFVVCLGFRQALPNKNLFAFAKLN